jgi:hypothetical protein
MNGIRYCGDLITEARLATDNEEFSDTQGISQQEFLRYLNEAQDFLQAEISNRFVPLSDKDYVVSVVANQEEYPLPTNCFGHGRVKRVEYSETSQERDYYKIPVYGAQARDSYPGCYVDGYWVRNNSIMLCPPLQSSIGSLRVSYEVELDNMDLRRGTIESLVYAGTVLTGIVMADDDYLDEITLGANHWFCVSDRDGVVKEYNLEGSYASDTNTLTCSLATSGIAVGHYVTVGKYSATHSSLPRNCERFLIEYTAQSVADRDNVTLSAQANSRIQSIVKSLLDTFALADKDTRRDGDFDRWFR